MARASFLCDHRLRSSFDQKTAMPLLKSLAPQDGRQSETALFVARGTRRLLRRLNYSTVAELPLLSGRRADIVALATDATIFIVEIKSSVADFRADSKWREYRAHCDRFFFAIPESVPVDIMPRGRWAYPGRRLWRRNCAAKRRSIAWLLPPAGRC